MDADTQKFYEAFGMACHESMRVAFPQMSHSHPGHEWESNLYATGVHAGIRFAVEYQRLALRMKRKLWREPSEFEGTAEVVDVMVGHLEPVLLGAVELEGEPLVDALIAVGDREDEVGELVIPDFDKDGKLVWVAGVMEDLDVELDARRGADGGA